VLSYLQRLVGRDDAEDVLQRVFYEVWPRPEPRPPSRDWGAMLAVVGLAASASEATGSLAGQFAFCQAAIRMVLVALYLRAYRHVVQARGVIAVYLTAGSIAAGLGWPGRWCRGRPGTPPGWSRLRPR
jgi:hypothetical protein